MANLKLRLTEAICARSRPADIEYAIRDLGQDNLTLRIRPSGMRSWILRYRIDDKQQKVTLGSYPEMSLKEARKAAGSFNGKLTAPPLSRTMPLFSAFQKEHEKRHGARYKPSGLVIYRSYVSRQLLPAFGRKRIDAIRRVDIIRWFETYSLTSPGAANRALGILTQMLNCAKVWGYFPEGWINPASSLRYNRRNRMGTFLSMEQMERLGAVLSRQAGQGCLASALLHVLALTGCRVGEIIRLEWGDVLHDRLRLKDSKTGPRDVPLGVSAYHYIEARRKVSKEVRGLVFPLPQPSPYEAVRKVWNKAKHQANLPPGLRIHDLRHSFASHAIMAGESLFTVSRLLGHSRVQTTARYAHLADHALLDCAEKVGRLILAQAAPPAPRRLRRDSRQRDEATPYPAPICEDAHAIQLHGGEQHGDRRGS